jgi:MFS superfamily sulfate permease-like transporter
MRIMCVVVIFHSPATPFDQWWRGGDRELVFYGLSVFVILVTDLLTGVLFGVFLALLNLSANVLRFKSMVMPGGGNNVTVKFMGVAGFTALPTLGSTLEKISPRQSVLIDVTSLLHIDSSCIDIMEQWEKRYKSQGGTVTVNWDDIVIRKKTYVARAMEKNGSGLTV